MNIAICDDEAAIRQQISELVACEDSGAGVEEFETSEELLLSEKKYDLVFLDIIMQGLSGVEAARRLRKQDKAVCIVFITGYREYVFDAFDVGALHYLLKPIKSEKFKEVYKRACAESRKHEYFRNSLVIRTRKSTEKIKFSDIFYAESQLKKLIIHTVNHTVSYYGSMNELEKQLGEGFYRCHRGYLINFFHIAGYNGEAITLKNGEKVYIAKERYADFVKSYLAFLKDGGASLV